MTKKIIVIGDSHTFYMSGDPRRKYFLEALQKDNIELYPIYWTSFFNDSDGGATYCWRMATPARKITPEIIDEMLTHDQKILDRDKKDVHLVFALGAMDFFVHIQHTNDPVPPAEDYFDAVHSYCTEHGFSFSFASPVYSNSASHLIDEFNNTLAKMSLLYGVGGVITYPEHIPYKKYDPVDKFNHANFEIMDSVASYIKQSIH